LPDSIGNLSALTELIIFNYYNLPYIVLPNSICFCKNLQSINVQNIYMLPPSMILLEKINEIKVINNCLATIQNINELRSLWKKQIAQGQAPRTTLQCSVMHPVRRLIQTQGAG